MRTFTTILTLAILVAVIGTASAQTNNAENFVIARVGLRNGMTYSLIEGFQQRGKAIYPDCGAITFNQPGLYREVFCGAGAMLLNSKHLTVIEEGYIDQATGPQSGGATYFQPWTFVGYRLTKKVGGETVYFPYIPLNKAARIQHVLERATMEYDLGKHFKAGGGYGAYKFGDGGWDNKPFLTTTVKAGKLGNFEFWLQRVPGNHAMAQIRYAKSWK